MTHTADLQRVKSEISTQQPAGYPTVSTETEKRHIPWRWFELLAQEATTVPDVHFTFSNVTTVWESVVNVSYARGGGWGVGITLN